MKKVFMTVTLTFVLIIFLVFGYMSGYSNGDCYIVDENGNYVNNKGYKEIRTGFLDNGLATVLVENRWKPGSLFYQEYLLVIDASGKVVYKIKADDIYNIVNNAVPHKKPNSTSVASFIDNSGRIIYKVPDDKVISVFDCEYMKNDLVPFRDGTYYGKQGFVNMENEVVVQPIYDSVWNYDENGLAKVCLGEKYGFVNMYGENIVEPIYKYVEEFSEGLAVVETDDGKYGYINTDGEWIIEPMYDWAFSFSDGFARARIGDEFFYIDNKGNVVLKTEGEDFHDGYAKIQKDNKYAYMDKAGKLITDFVFDSECDDFYNGFARVSYDGVYGFINGNGSFVIEPQFLWADRFDAEGHSMVKTKEGLWGYINSDGTWFLEPVFLEATDFHGGVALVKVAEK